MLSMDNSLIQQLIDSNKPFEIATAAGEHFFIPHRDFVSFSLKRTSLLVHYERNGKERFAILPLLTITSATAAEDPAEIPT